MKYKVQNKQDIPFGSHSDNELYCNTCTHFCYARSFRRSSVPLFFAHTHTDCRLRMMIVIMVSFKRFDLSSFSLFATNDILCARTVLHYCTPSTATNQKLLVSPSPKCTLILCHKQRLKAIRLHAEQCIHPRLLEAQHSQRVVLCPSQHRTFVQYSWPCHQQHHVLQRATPF